MSDTPNQNIEKQLRDYARERREAAGAPQMHPATRQLLQAEVKQQFGNVSAAPGKQSWLIIWPRFALGSLVLASLVAMFVVINRQESILSRNSFTLAKSEAPEPVMTPAASLELVSAPTEAREERSAKSAGALNEPLANAAVDRKLAAKPGSLAATAPAKESDSTILAGRSDVAQPFGAPTTSLTDDATSRRTGSTVVASKMGKSAKGAPAPAAMPAPVSRASLELNNSTTQRFFNAASVSAASGTRAPVVLDEFIVEQAGNSLKIVDRDGSVYRGQITVATNAVEAQAVLAGFAPSAPQTVSASAQSDGAKDKDAYSQSAQTIAPSAAQVQNGIEPLNYAFEVEGTNRSLRQRVVFNGNWIQNAPALNAQNISNTTQQFQNQAAPAGQIQSLNYNLQNNFINGRVYLNNSRSGTELNALPVNESQR